MNGGNKNMRKKNLLLKIVGFLVVLMLFFGTFGATCVGEEPASTELQILSIKGGIGKVTLEVKNVGDVVAEDIKLIISVKGGLLGRIDLYKECTGCDQCGTTLDPSATRTESTAEKGLIFGLGAVEIYVSANASNADEVTQTTNGFVIGFLVLIM